MVDLSQVLDEEGRNELLTAEEIRNLQEESPSSEKKVSGLYGLAIKFSGGLIKTEKQAKIVLVILIILMNAITFSLLFGGNKTAQQTNMPADAQMQVPTAQPTE